MTEKGVLIKKAASNISVEKNDRPKWLLAAELDKADLEHSVLQLITLSTVVISLFEELEDILRYEPYEVKANPEQGFESSIMAEARLVLALRTVILCTLSYVSSSTQISVSCGEKDILIYINGCVASNELIKHFKEVVSRDSEQSNSIDNSLDRAAQIIFFSRASIRIEKNLDNGLIWIISFGKMK